MTIEKIILGTVQLGLNYGVNNREGKPTETEALRILHEAHKQGIRYLDTAAAYGTSEELIGKYHKNSGNTFSVITKFHGTNEQNVEKQISVALDKLNTKRLDGLLYHSYRNFKDSPDLLRKLTEEVKANRIGKIGVSVYENSEIEDLLNYPEVEIIQAPFNLLDNANRRGEVLQRAKEEGKIIHTRSVFLQGLFFSELNNLSDQLLPLRGYLKQLKDLAIENNITLNEIALAYSLHQPFIDGVLIGVDNEIQLKKNIVSVSKGVIDKELMEKINEIEVTENIAHLLNPVNWK